jgi:hypothetical protein
MRGGAGLSEAAHRASRRLRARPYAPPTSAGAVCRAMVKHPAGTPATVSAGRPVCHRRLHCRGPTSCDHPHVPLTGCRTTTPAGIPEGIPGGPLPRQEGRRGPGRTPAARPGASCCVCRPSREAGVRTGTGGTGQEETRGTAASLSCGPRRGWVPALSRHPARSRGFPAGGARERSGSGRLTGAVSEATAAPGAVRGLDSHVGVAVLPPAVAAPTRGGCDGGVARAGNSWAGFGAGGLWER